jgi:hypothetical protein
VRMNPRVLAVSALCTAAAVAGISGIVSALPAVAANDAPPSIEETFEYPNGDKTPGVTLKKGDGHVLLVGCDEGKTSVVVYRYGSDDPFCFQFKGKQGYVTLEIQKAYGIRNYNNFSIDAKVKVDDQQKTINVAKDTWAGIGVDSPAGSGVLLELRAQ